MKSNKTLICASVALHALIFGGCSSVHSIGAPSSGYDVSTLASPFVTVPVYQTPTAIIFPQIASSNIREGLIEAKDFAKSTSRRFFFHIKDTQAKIRGPFIFAGGDINSLRDTVASCGVFADVLYTNTLLVSSEKTVTLPIAETKDAKSLTKKLRAIKGVSNVKVIGVGQEPTATLTATPNALKEAKRTIEMHNVKKNASFGFKTEGEISLLEACKKLYPYANVTYFDGSNHKIDKNGVVIRNIDDVNRVLAEDNKKIEKVYIDKKDGTKEMSFIVSKYQPIVLDRPYTLKGLVKEIGKRQNIEYVVNMDTNVPVNKNVKIEKLEDLNQYLRNTTGHTFSVKKSESGNVVIDKQ